MQSDDTINQRFFSPHYSGVAELTYVCGRIDSYILWPNWRVAELTRIPVDHSLFSCADPLHWAHLSSLWSIDPNIDNYWSHWWSLCRNYRVSMDTMQTAIYTALNRMHTGQWWLCLFCIASMVKTLVSMESQPILHTFPGNFKVYYVKISWVTTCFLNCRQTSIHPPDDWRSSSMGHETTDSSMDSDPPVLHRQAYMWAGYDWTVTMLFNLRCLKQCFF